MDKSQKKIISAVILGICLLQILIIAARYFQTAYNLNNPLIPDVVVKSIRDFNLTLIALHVFAGLFNVFYLISKRYFRFTLITSLIILAAVALLKMEIHSWFLSVSNK